MDIFSYKYTDKYTKHSEASDLVNGFVSGNGRTGSVLAANLNKIPEQ